MQQEPSIRKPNRSRDSSKRSRQVNEKEAEDYLKRPVSKISNPNRDLKNAYGKKHLENPKFNYIHKLKQIRKTGDDSISEHGDTDDQDFDLNELSGKRNKKSQVKKKNLRTKRQKSQRKVKQSMDVEKQSDVEAEEPEKLEKDGNQSRKEPEKKVITDEESNNQKMEVSEQGSDVEQQKVVQKDHQQPKKNQLKQSHDKMAEKQQKIKQEQSDSSANEQKYSSDEPKEEQKQSKSDQSVQIVQNADRKSEKSNSSKMDEEKPSKSENREEQGQQKSQKSKIAEQQNLHSSEQYNAPVAKVQIEKTTKKKGKARKIFTLRRSNRRSIKSVSKKKKLTKEKATQLTQERKNSTIKVQDKGKSSKISGKSKPKPVKDQQTNTKQQESGTERVRTRNRPQIQEAKTAASQRINHRGARIANSRGQRKLQRSAKRETKQSKSKTKSRNKKKAETPHSEPAQFQPGQQNLDKFMQKISQGSNKSLRNSKVNEQPLNNSTITMQMSYMDFQNALKQQTSKAIREQLQQRRKSLKISSRVVVESLFCFDKRRVYDKGYFKPKGYRYEIKVDQSSDEDHQLVVARRNNKGEKQKFKRYRKILVGGSRSEEDYPYISSRKHKKEKQRAEEDDERLARRERSRHRKRKYRQIRESSESGSSSSEVMQKEQRSNQGYQQETSVQRSAKQQK